jgi:ketosteroid isomerase-like protein
MRSSIAGGILLGMIGLVCAAQSQIARDEAARVLSLENSWNQAEVNHDLRAMYMLLADTFVYTDDDGSFRDKNQWLDHLDKGGDQYELLGNSNMKVELYGDSAVVTGEYREKIKEKGKMVAHSGRFTDIWIRHSGQWKCVASQSTLISH